MAFIAGITGPSWRTGASGSRWTTGKETLSLPVVPRLRCPPAPVRPLLCWSCWPGISGAPTRGRCHSWCQDSAQHPGVERSSHSPPQWGHCTGPASGRLGLLAVSVDPAACAFSLDQLIVTSKVSPRRACVGTRTALPMMCHLPLLFSVQGAKGQEGARGVPGAAGNPVSPALPASGGSLLMALG